MKAKFFYLGHGSLRFETAEGQFIYVDPYAGEDYGPGADFLLVTHEHYDHNAVELVTKNPGCLTVTWKEALSGGRHNSFEKDGVVITAVPACNKNHDITKCVGYVVAFDGIKVYCAGDTSIVGEMQEVARQKVDYAFLPVDGVYNMAPEEAGRCAELIGCRHVVPVHTLVGGYDRSMAERVDVPGRIVVEPGETLEL
ncbi:MAG: MBL fold metallo-hydrolase [Oscillospiraceae bacterium]|nr:MBL fold metallo-hydrolase [Oscillospiraceae bacterium]